jgi:hypothetical protein
VLVGIGLGGGIGSGAGAGVGGVGFGLTCSTSALEVDVSCELWADTAPRHSATAAAAAEMYKVPRFMADSFA